MSDLVIEKIYKNYNFLENKKIWTVWFIINFKNKKIYIFYKFYFLHNIRIYLFNLLDRLHFLRGANFLIKSNNFNIS